MQYVIRVFKVFFKSFQGSDSKPIPDELSLAHPFLVLINLDLARTPLHRKLGNIVPSFLFHKYPTHINNQHFLSVRLMTLNCILGQNYATHGIYQNTHIQ